MNGWDLELKIRDTLADARARRRAKRREHEDPEYLAWLHGQPCCCCGALPIEAHHQPRKSQAGWHDRSTLPLCTAHHRGRHGIHALGVEGFERLHRIDVVERIRVLKQRYANEKESPHARDRLQP